MMFFVQVAAAVLLSVTQPAQAREWRHVELQSTDQTTIRLDYQLRKQERPDCYKCNVPTFATPLWLHVEHPRLNPSSEVRLVLLNWRHIPWSRGAKDLDTLEIDLSYAARGRFSFELRQPLRIHESGYGGTFKHSQEIAVVIDGKWLVDPISLSNNFSLNLWDSAY